MLINILVLLGLAPFLKLLLNILISLYHHFRRADDLPQRYGTGSWAMVTGATDGIGLGFCEELAAQGFNIVLVSRSGKKLEEKIKQLRQGVNAKIEYKYITADFTQCWKPDFFTQIRKSIQQLDVSVIVNNVGISNLEYIEEQSEEIIRNQINVNTIAMTVLTSLAVQKMKKRQKKGAIINISSYSCVNPMPYMSTYAATKGYNDVFSRSCAKQHPELHILSVRAMKVLSGKVKGGKSLTIPTSRECAHDSLKYLGYCDITAGHIKHQILSHVTQMIPEKIFTMIAMKQAKKAYQEYSPKKE